MKIQFFVSGIPQPGGSKKGFLIPGTGRVNIVDANKAKVMPWRASVARAARDAYPGEPLTGALEASFLFIMPRIKSHYGTGKNASRLRSDAPKWHTVKPDRTKLLRAVEDALTGILWRDDAQIVDGPVQKVYGDFTGAMITVWERDRA